MHKPKINNLVLATVLGLCFGGQAESSFNVAFGFNAAYSFLFARKLGLNKGIHFADGKNDSITKGLKQIAYNKEDAGDNSPVLTAADATKGVKAADGDEFYPIEAGSGVPGKAITGEDLTAIGEDDDARLGYDHTLANIAKLANQIFSDVKKADATLIATQLNLKDGDALLSGTKPAEYDMQYAEMLRRLRFDIFALAQWSISDLFSVGGKASIGISTEKIKNADKDADLTEARSFFASLAFVLGISKYVDLELGLGVARHTIEFKQNDANKAVFNDARSLLADATKAAESFINDKTFAAGASSQDKQALDKLVKSSKLELLDDKTLPSWIVYAYAALVGKVPVTENIYARVSLGVETDLNGAERGNLNGAPLTLSKTPVRGFVGLGVQMSI